MQDDDVTIETPGASVRVGYVLKVFPRVSETFVINEIRALESIGEHIEIFSLHTNPNGPVRHAILDKLRAVPEYVDQVLPPPEVVHKTREQLATALQVSKEHYDRFLPRKYIRLAIRLAELAAERKVEHLHAHFATRSAHVALLAARLLGIPYSMTAHAKDIYHDDVDPEVLRWKLSASAFTVTVTEYNRRHLAELLKGRESQAGPVVRLYNGVDLSRFRATPVPSGPVPQIVSVGRLVEKKGFDVLVEACAMVRDRGIRFECEIIGGGDLAEPLERQIRSSGLEDLVRLAGELTTEQVAERLQAASIVALSAVRGRDGNVDALPTVLIEAMACGRATISTRLSGIPEIIEHESTGLLVEPGDAAALADAIECLLGSPETVARMGLQGRARAEKLFDLRQSAATLQGLFDENRKLLAASR